MLVWFAEWISFSGCFTLAMGIALATLKVLTAGSLVVAALAREPRGNDLGAVTAAAA